MGIRQPYERFFSSSFLSQAVCCCSDISEHEVRDKLDPVLPGGEVQACPGCGESMTICKANKANKANKGKNAGSIFWVCNDFPTCRGVTKA